MPEKLSNPKDDIGDTRAPLHLIPETALIQESLAFLEGALKYGAHNWRAAGVRTSVYMAACMRHLFKYWNGEDEDPLTRIHHLGNARACLGIILDAQAVGKLTDDRPPANPGMIKAMKECEETVAHLKELFKDHHPKHWTINDDIPGANDKSPEECLQVARDNLAGAADDVSEAAHADACRHGWHEFEKTEFGKTEQCKWCGLKMG